MSTSDFQIREANPGDLPDILFGLKSLASDMGDSFKATPKTISQALFGTAAHSFVLLSGASGNTQGIVHGSPFLSTTLGCTCIYVSDLWVARASRGQSLGRQLLISAAHCGNARWHATGLVLNVYEDNTAAKTFYQHLGFEMHQPERRAALTGAALSSLINRGSDESVC